MKTSFSTRIKRLFAFVIDWNICLLPALLYSIVLNQKLVSGESPSVMIMLLFVLVVLFSMALVVTRDFIMGGRSLGKRIFRLFVVDKNTLQRPSLVKLFFRGVFVFALEADGIIMLATGNAIADMVFGSMVLSKKELAIARGQLPPEESKPISAVKIVVLVVAVFLAFIIFLLGVIFATLDAKKDSAEYAVAYEYLVNSEDFKSLGADPEKLFMNSYSHNVYYYDGVPETTAVMSFKSGFFNSFTVVCHLDENNEWYVCDECTIVK